MGVCTDAGKWHCHCARSTGKSGRAERGEGVPEEEEAEPIRDIKNGQRGNERAGKSPKKVSQHMGEWAKIVGFRSALLNGCGLKPYMNLFYLFTSGQQCQSWVLWLLSMCEHVWIKCRGNPPPAATLCLNVLKSPSHMCCPVKYQHQLAWWSGPTEGLA